MGRQKPQWMIDRDKAAYDKAQRECPMPAAQRKTSLMASIDYDEAAHADPADVLKAGDAAAVRALWGLPEPADA